MKISDPLPTSVKCCVARSHNRPPNFTARKILPTAHCIAGVDPAIAIGVESLQPDNTSIMTIHHFDHGQPPFRHWHVMQGAAGMYSPAQRRILNSSSFASAWVGTGR